MSWLPRVQEHIQSNVTQFRTWPGTRIVCHSLPLSFCLAAVEVTWKAGHDNLENVRLLERIQKVYGWVGGGGRSYVFVSGSNQRRPVYLACAVITTTSEQSLFLGLIAWIHIYQDCVQIHVRWPVECISNVSPVTNDEILFPCLHVILSAGATGYCKTSERKKKKKRIGHLWLFAISNQMLCEMFSEWAGMGRWPVLKLCRTICSLRFSWIHIQPSVVAAFTLHSVKNTAARFRWLCCQLSLHKMEIGLETTHIPCNTQVIRKW